MSHEHGREPNPFRDVPDVDERLCDYVDGCLSSKETGRLEAELRVNAKLRQQLEDYRATVADLREALLAPTVDEQEAVDRDTAQQGGGSSMAERVFAALASGEADTSRVGGGTGESIAGVVAAKSDALPSMQVGGAHVRGSTQHGGASIQRVARGRLLPLVFTFASAAALLGVAVWLDAFGARTGPEVSTSTSAAVMPLEDAADDAAGAAAVGNSEAGRPKSGDLTLMDSDVVLDGSGILHLGKPKAGRAGEPPKGSAGASLAEKSEQQLILENEESAQAGLTQALPEAIKAGPKSKRAAADKSSDQLHSRSRGGRRGRPPEETLRGSSPAAPPLSESARSRAVGRGSPAPARNAAPSGPVPSGATAGGPTPPGAPGGPITGGPVMGGAEGSVRDRSSYERNNGNDESNRGEAMPRAQSLRFAYRFGLVSEEVVAAAGSLATAVREGGQGAVEHLPQFRLEGPAATARERKPMLMMRVKPGANEPRRASAESAVEERVAQFFFEQMSGEPVAVKMSGGVPTEEYPFAALPAFDEPSDIQSASVRPLVLRMGAAELRPVAPRSTNPSELLEAERRERHWLLSGPQSAVALVLRELRRAAEASKRTVRLGEAGIAPIAPAASEIPVAGALEQLEVDSTKSRAGRGRGGAVEPAVTRRVLLRFRPSRR